MQIHPNSYSQINFVGLKEKLNNIGSLTGIILAASGCQQSPQVAPLTTDKFVRRSNNNVDVQTLYINNAQKINIIEAPLAVAPAAQQLREGQSLLPSVNVPNIIPTSPVQPTQTFPNQVQPLQDAGPIKVSAGIPIEKVCETIKPATVTIYAGQDIGSGSNIHPDGLIVTNNHVIERLRDSSEGPEVVFNAGEQKFQGKILGTDKQNDLALIEITNLPAGTKLPYIAFDDGVAQNSTQDDTNVCAVGSPYGQPGILATGNIETVSKNGDYKSKLKLAPGDSGGPLVNADGEMIAVNKAIWEEDGQNMGISFATSVSNLLGFIGRLINQETSMQKYADLPQFQNTPQENTVLPQYPQPNNLQGYNFEKTTYSEQKP